MRVVFFNESLPAVNIQFFAAKALLRPPLMAEQTVSFSQGSG
jgi:hypothetical protein